MLRAVVESGLELEWSPEQISHRLRLDHPDNPVMRVSHETIYMSIYQPHRRAVKAKLHRQLRTGRLMRHPKLAAVPSGRGRLKNMVLIADRPVEVADRLAAGHWEGDLVMGTRPSAMATLVERTTRFLRVVALPGGIKAPPPGAGRPGRGPPSDRPRAAAVADGGPRPGDGRARPAHHRHRVPGVLLRPALTVAARHEREHESATASVPVQER